MKIHNAFLQFRKLLPQPNETLPQKLDRLAEIQRQEMTLMKPYHEQIAAIEAKMKKEINPLTEMIQNLEKEIKAKCIQLQETVQGSTLQVVFVSGRVTWESKGLEGYAVDHPAVLRFRKVGKPTARLQEMK